MLATLQIEQHCPADFTYTKNSNHTIQGVDDAAEYNKLVHSMTIMGISTEERIEFFRIIVAVLYLGNIVVNHQYGRVDISEYDTACRHLGISPVLFKKYLLEPQIRAGNEWVSQAKSPSQIKDSLDALAKVLYERNFNHIVHRINVAIDGPRSLTALNSDDRFIGVLDIAGFEIFQFNSFEQLCINYTNEKLQDFFNHNMFVLEEKEYQRENIQCDASFDYRNDLQPTIQLIENPVGILSCLEDECVTQGNDTRLLAKITQQNKSNPRYKADMYNEGFSIKHYAGEVKYTTSGWIERGKDPLNEHVARLFAESTNPHVAVLFKDYGNGATGTPTISGTLTRDIRYTNNKKSLIRTRKGGGSFHTVGTKHKQQLHTLMQTLHNTHPHFVRCILPNDRKRPGEIQPLLVLHQLRCNGVLEGIRICRIGFPNRLPFAQFREQYKLLAPDLNANETDHRKACHHLLQTTNLPTEAFQIGRTKVFFKAGILGQLEEQRDVKLSQIATQIQAACLRLIARRKVTQRQSQDQLIRTIQRNSRIYIDIMQSRLWKVYHRRKELEYTFGEENANRKKVEDLEQVLAASQEQCKQLVQEQAQMQKAHEEELQLVRLALQQEQESKLELVKELNQTQTQLLETQEALTSTKQLSEEQAVMLSKMHKDMKEECDENEALMVQCDDLCRENTELQERVEFLENDKTVSDELQMELDRRDQEIQRLEEDVIAELKEEVDNERQKNQERDRELMELRKEMVQYKGEVYDKTLAHDKIQTSYQTLELKMAKEVQEKKMYQKKNSQLERDVDMLAKLVQSEAKESRTRAERYSYLFVI